MISPNLIRRKPLKHDTVTTSVGRLKIHDMTVCIAHTCKHEGSDAIVLCCDSQGTYGHFIKNNELYKMRLHGRFTIMFSDDPTNADSLISLMLPTLRRFEAVEKSPEDLDIRVSALLEDLRAACRTRRTQILEHHVGMTYGVSYEDFREHSRKWFSESHHDKTWKAIARLSLQCSMIIAYADDTEPLIIRIESDGRPVWEECYSCTGSGYEIAMAYLCQKDYDERMPLMECLARVFMAKKMAQKNPYVGNESSFDILINGDGNSSRRVLTDDGWRYLRENASQKDNFHALVFNEEFLAAKRAGRQKSEAILSIDHR